MTSRIARIAPIALLLPALAAGTARAQQPAAPAASPPSPPAAPAPAAPPALPAMSAGPQFRELPADGAKPAAAEVFRRHLAATGGEAAWEAKTQARVRGAVEIPAAGLKGSMEMLTMAPNRVVMTIDIPGMGQTRSGCDGGTGWTIDPMRGPALMGDAEVAELLRDANFQRDLALARDPGTAEVVGLFEFGGVPCWRVKVAGSGTKAREMSHFYEKDSGLMRGMSLRAPTPMGEVPAVIETTDYREFGDVRLPAVTTTKVLGQSQVMRVDSVEWSGVDAAAFELPAEIKALKAAPAAPPAPTAAPTAPAAPTAAPSSAPAAAPAK